jgi:4-amino-4-deoxy-L-arabinose transferase-like glycosyltransferase
MTDAIRRWWRDESPTARATVVAILVLGAAVRFASLAQPMRYDEAVTYLLFVGQTWGTAIKAYPSTNNHLLYTLLAKITSAMGGGAPWAIRLPAFIAGVAVVPLTYAVGRALFTPAAALIGSALAAASTTLGLYSTNARGYSFIVAGYLVLLLIAARVRGEGGTPRRWIAFALVAAAGMATIPLMVYPIGAVVLWLAFALAVEHPSRARAELAALAAAMACSAVLAGLAYAPIITANGLAALTANRFVARSPWPVFFRELLPSLGDALASWVDPFPLVFVPLLAATLVVGAMRSVRVSREGVSVITAALIWSAVVLVANHHAPLGHAWLWLVPIVCLLVGVGAEALLRRLAPRRGVAAIPLVAVATVALGVMWGLFTDAEGESLDTGLFRGADAVAQSLRTNSQPGDRVIAAIPANAPLQFYLNRHGADTAVLSTPSASTRRDILVLDRAYGQTVEWAIAAAMIDTARFGPIAPAMHALDADVYVAERKARSP